METTSKNTLTNDEIHYLHKIDLPKLVKSYNKNQITLESLLPIVINNMKENLGFKLNPAVEKQIIKFLTNKIKTSSPKSLRIVPQNDIPSNKKDTIDISIAFYPEDATWRLGKSLQNILHKVKLQFITIKINNFIIISDHCLKELTPTGYNYYEFDQNGLFRKSKITNNTLEEIVRTPQGTTKKTYKIEPKNFTYKDYKDLETTYQKLNYDNAKMEKYLWTFTPPYQEKQLPPSKKPSSNQEILTQMSETGNRELNQDRTLIIKNRSDKNLKLLAVADGMGGSINGDYAAQKTIDELRVWFANLNPNIINNTALITKELSQKIEQINQLVESYSQQLKNQYGLDAYTGTTLTLALINKDKTIIANVGDSRCYLMHQTDLKQITEDDSVVWNFYKRGFLTKDEARCHIQNNILTKHIGISGKCFPKIYQINNEDYDGLLLLTDGVTDCLSDAKIRFIANTSSREKILENIINEALYKKQPQVKITNKMAECDIFEQTPGKDNASGICYKKTH